MSDENVSIILREIDLLRKENKDDHIRIEKHAEHTNGTVAELVAWKIQVKTVLWIFGTIISTIVVPVGIMLLNEFIKSRF